MKTTFRKLKPKIINYRKYKHFSNVVFRDTLLEELPQVRTNNDDDGFNNLPKICWNTLDSTSGGNNAPFMNKTLREKCLNTEFFLVRIFFGLNTERYRVYGVSLRIQSECGKIRTRKNSVFGQFSRSETLSKEIIKKSNLRNKYLKGRSEEDTQKFVKQRNLYVSLLRKTKKSYYSNLNEKNIIDD